MKRTQLMEPLTSPSTHVNPQTHYTPVSTSLRRPLGDITGSVRNRKTVEQVVAEGEALTAALEASIPRPSFHCFKTQKRFSNLRHVGSNLMDRFSADDENESLGRTTQVKRTRGRPKKIQTHCNVTSY